MIKNGSVYIQKLSGVNDISAIADKKDLTEKTVSKILENAELYIPLGELVDKDKEIARLTAELDRLNDEVARANGKLSNRGFIDKAPKALVEKEYEKLNTYLEMRNKVQQELDELNS